MRRAGLAIGALILLGSSSSIGADWQAAKGPLMTRWAKEVSPERVQTARLEKPPHRLVVGREQQDGAVADDDLHLALVVLDA